MTAAGKSFYEHCTAMVAEAQAAHESIHRLQAEPTGTVRISCPTVLAQYYVSTILPSFMAMHPKVQVVVNATDRPVHIIEERIDIALRVRETILDDPGMIARKLAVTHMVLVASPGYVESHGALQDPSDLSTLDTISSLRDSVEGQQTWQLLGPEERIVRVAHQPKLFCQDLRVQYEAAVRGVGVALIPYPLVINAIGQGLLVRLLPEWHSGEEIIHAVLSTRRGMLPSVRALLDYLVLHLPAALHL